MYGFHAFGKFCTLMCGSMAHCGQKYTIEAIISEFLFLACRVQEVGEIFRINQNLKQIYTSKYNENPHEIHLAQAASGVGLRHVYVNACGDCSR